MSWLNQLENSVSEAWDSSVTNAIDGAFGGGGGGAAPSSKIANKYPERMHPQAIEGAQPSNKILGMSPLVLAGGGAVLLLLVVLMVKK
jgi:hypothetical protein